MDPLQWRRDHQAAERYLNEHRIGLSDTRRALHVALLASALEELRARWERTGRVPDVECGPEQIGLCVDCDAARIFRAELEAEKQDGGRSDGVEGAGPGGAA